MNRALKLLHVVPQYLPAIRYGGLVLSVHGLCSALAARGHSVSVFTSDLDGPSRIPLPPGGSVTLEGVAVHYFPAVWGRLCWCPSMQEALSERIGTFDLVHLHSVFLWPTWAAARAARRANIPYVLAPHGMLVRELVRRKSRLAKALWIRGVERRSIEGAIAIHVSSKIEESELSAFGFKLPPVFVVPSGVSPKASLWTADQLSVGVRDVLARSPLVLFLGRVSWKKGLDALIPALAHVEGAHLVVAGNDEEGLTGELRQTARDSGVADRVTFLGPVQGPDKAALLAGADVFVLPSYSENFAIAVLEAMEAGCPVLVSREVGLAEEVERAGAGLVVDRDPARLGAAISRLIGEPDTRREMGRRGREVALQRYTWPAVAAAMESQVEALIRPH